MTSTDQRANELSELANRARYSTLVEGAVNVVALEDGDGQPMVLRADELELFERPATGHDVMDTIERLGRLRANHLADLAAVKDAAADEPAPLPDVVTRIRRLLDEELEGDAVGEIVVSERVRNFAASIAALHPISHRQAAAADSSAPALTAVTAAAHDVVDAAGLIPGGMWEGRLEDLAQAITRLATVSRHPDA